MTTTRRRWPQRPYQTTLWASSWKQQFQTSKMASARFLLLCVLSSTTFAIGHAGSFGGRFQALSPSGEKSHFSGSDDHSVRSTGSSCDSTGGIVSHNGSMWKGEILLGIVLPSPKRTVEAEMCCNIAGSSYRTAKFSIVALGPSKTRPGQTVYMCTIYSSDATLKSAITVSTL